MGLLKKKAKKPFTVRSSSGGASPTEIESSVLMPIEQAIEGIQDIQEVTATAAENFGSIRVELKTGAPATSSPARAGLTPLTRNPAPTR